MSLHSERACVLVCVCACHLQVLGQAVLGVRIFRNLPTSQTVTPAQFIHSLIISCGPAPCRGHAPWSECQVCYSQVCVSPSSALRPCDLEDREQLRATLTSPQQVEARLTGAHVTETCWSAFDDVIRLKNRFILLWMIRLLT